MRLRTMVILLGAIPGCSTERAEPTEPLIAPRFVASRSSIQYAGLVLKKLEPVNPPSYPEDFFTPSLDGISSGGREKLSDAVASVVRVMTDPATPGPDYCGPIVSVLTTAIATNQFFDISRTSNPALEDFRRDWERVKQLAGC